MKHVFLATILCGSSLVGAASDAETTARVSATGKTEVIAKANTASKTEVIKLPSTSIDYFEIVKPPKSRGLRSGLVTLAPQKSVGKHPTGDYEELVVVLEGQGEMTVIGGEKIQFSKGEVLYAPPHVEHDVLNTGIVPLKYIYVVAKTNGQK